MKRPHQKFLGFTWLGWVNLFLQFIFVRLTLSCVSEPKHAEFERITAWGLLFAIPLTGWSFTCRWRAVKRVLWLWRHPTLFAATEKR